MNELQIIKDVRCYVDKDNVAQLNLEDVARGLGFIQNKNGTEYIRWETITRYLKAFEFSQNVGKDGYIPEPIFYLLAMKADNETARTFQHTIAYDVLPAIRRYGLYAVDQLLDDPDIAIQAFTALKEEREKRRALEAQVQANKPKVIFANAVSAAHTSILVGELAKIIKQNGVSIGQNRLFKWLRDNGYLIKRNGTDFNMPTQRSMEMGLFEIKETVIAHSDGHTSITKTPKVTGNGQCYFINKILGVNAGA